MFSNKPVQFTCEEIWLLEVHVVDKSCREIEYSLNHE